MTSQKKTGIGRSAEFLPSFPFYPVSGIVELQCCFFELHFSENPHSQNFFHLFFGVGGIANYAEE